MATAAESSARKVMTWLLLCLGVAASLLPVCIVLLASSEGAGWAVAGILFITPALALVGGLTSLLAAYLSRGKVRRATGFIVGGLDAAVVLVGLVYVLGTIFSR